MRTALTALTLKVCEIFDPQCFEALPSIQIPDSRIFACSTTEAVLLPWHLTSRPAISSPLEGTTWLLVGASTSIKVQINHSGTRKEKEGYLILEIHVFGGPAARTLFALGRQGFSMPLRRFGILSAILAALVVTRRLAFFFI